MKAVRHISITTIFALSFFSYFKNPTLLTQSLPIVLLAIYALANLILAPKTKINHVINSLLKPSNLIVLVVLPVVAFVPCLFSLERINSLGNLVLLTVTLVSAKIILINENLEKILKDYFNAGVVSIVAFIAVFPSSFQGSLSSSGRLSGGYFHPNLIGFIMLGYIGSQIWMLNRSIQSGAKKLQVSLHLILLIVTFFLLFESKSRGSILAFLGSLSIVTILLIVKRVIKKASFKENKRDKSNHSRELTICFISLILVLAIYLIYSQINLPNLSAAIEAYLDESLALSNSGRGLNSGLSGRTDTWTELLKNTSLYQFLVGTGYRTSSEIYGDVDNGYLVGLYEMGLIPFLIIILKHTSNIFKFSHKYILLNDKNTESISVAVVFLTTGLLINCFVARYLIGIGNPFSLLCIFFLVL